MVEFSLEFQSIQANLVKKNRNLILLQKDFEHIVKEFQGQILWLDTLRMSAVYFTRAH